MNRPNLKGFAVLSDPLRVPIVPRWRVKLISDRSFASGVAVVGKHWGTKRISLSFNSKEVFESRRS